MALTAWELDSRDDDFEWWAAVMAATVADTIPATLLERLEVMRPGWHRGAACKGGAVDFFSADPGEVEAAAMLCSGCPVRAECETAGQREPAGMWGGRWRGVPSARPAKPPAEPGPPVRRSCSECEADEVHALGLCLGCYRRHRRRQAGAVERPVGRSVAACSECPVTGPLTRSLCSACYSRERRRRVALGA